MLRIRIFKKTEKSFFFALVLSFFYLAGPTLQSHPILLPPSVNLPVFEQALCQKCPIFAQNESVHEHPEADCKQLQLIPPSAGRSTV